MHRENNPRNAPRRRPPPPPSPPRLDDRVVVVVVVVRPRSRRRRVDDVVVRGMGDEIREGIRRRGGEGEEVARVARESRCVFLCIIVMFYIRIVGPSGF